MVESAATYLIVSTRQAQSVINNATPSFIVIDDTTRFKDCQSMNNKNKLADQKANAYRHITYALISTQLLLIVSILNSLFFSHYFIGHSNLVTILGIRLDVLLMGLCAILILPIYHMLHKNKLERATVCYFLLLSVTAAAMSVVEGGLNSVSIMTFPIIAIFSTLYTDKKVFFSICAFFCLMIVFMGFNHHYGWFEGLISTGIARVIDFIVVVLVSTIVAYLLGKQAKHSLLDLRQEHRQVLASKKVIQHLANTDSLTGLVNRASGENLYQEMQATMNTDKEEISLYFIDLDNFKSINSLFDHNIGDKLLITVAERLKRLATPETVACRLGGDEFVLFLKASKSFEHNKLADNMITVLSEPHSVLGTNAEITASIGVTVITDKMTDFDDARKRADMAMYKAKQSGKNTYHYYSEDLHHEHMKNLTILHKLKDALNYNLFDLHFQPKISLVTGETVGAEALLRWTRDNPDNLTADEFIPVIESTDLIHSIGRWVLQHACAACKKWHQSGHYISVAVNVSALQLTRADFVENVAEALRMHDLDAAYLELEFTEHFLIQKNTEIREQLQKLKGMGVKLAIDDFGTGYSNMGYLTHIDVDVLKLDRSFISHIKDRADALVIVTAIIEMASVLNMQVVAEGIEQESERSVVKQLGGSIGQGFLWSKALPHDALLDYLGVHEGTEPAVF